MPPLLSAGSVLVASLLSQPALTALGRYSMELYLFHIPVAAAFARLQNNALFQATLSAARTELASGQATPPDAKRCEQEASTLAMSR